jgi:peroxiredoxin
MLKNKITKLIAMVMAFAMTMAAAGCAQEPAPTDPPDAMVEYVVSVVNKGETAISKCSVEVFSDASKSQAVFKGMTNNDGQVKFVAAPGEYIAVVSRVPDGYAVAETYKLTGESTTIVLEPGVLTEDDLNSTKLALGDAMPDFTFSTLDGTKYVLSELLKEKKAVVLNFWYLNCQPCKMEFPYLQEAYEQFGDEIEVLALNSYDGNDAEVAAFKADNGYTFPMLKCDERWQKMMNFDAYPTTFIIDRFGNICMIHRGMVTETQTLLDMFGFFVSDDYEQTFVKSHSQLPKFVPTN